MATHASAEKASRQSDRRRDRNREFRGLVRTTLRKAREALADKKLPKDKLAAILKETESTIQRMAQKGKVLKPKTASRYVSRLYAAANRAN